MKRKSETHSVAILQRGVRISYLIHRCRGAWCKRTAQKHAKDFNQNPRNPGETAKVEEN